MFEYTPLLLKKRNIVNVYDAIPFWKLKLTGEEYEGLKSHLKSLVLANKDFSSLDFALYISEWWRRECLSASYREEIMKSLGLNDLAKINNALKEIKECGWLRMYKARVNEQRLLSVMFQGGLPLKWIIDRFNNNEYSYWTRKLAGITVLGDGDNDESSFLTAQKSQELAEFCDVIERAYNSDDFEQMPFYCDGTDDELYAKVVQIINGERVRHRDENPFAISWEFVFDDIAKELLVKYKIKPSSTLSKKYIDEKLDGRGKCKIHIYMDNVIVKTFEYINGTLFWKEDWIDEYTDSALIEIKHGENVLKSDYMVLSDEPIFIYRTDDVQCYNLGKKTGRAHRCIIPSQWLLEDNVAFQEYKYIDNDAEEYVKVVDFGDLSKEIKITNVKTKEERVLSFDNSPYKIICIADPYIGTPFLEPIVNVKGYQDFRLLDEDGREKRVTYSDTVCYRSLNGDWQNVVMQGRIFATVKKDGVSSMSTPPFINLSSLPECKVVYSDITTCHLRCRWQGGDIRPDKSKLEKCTYVEADDVWKICKSESDQLGVIPLVCKPNGQPSFTLHMDSPYKELIVYKPVFNGKSIRLQNSCKIPYSDLSSYQITGVRSVGVKVVFPNLGRQDRTRVYVDINGVSSLENVLNQVLDKLNISDVRQLLDATISDITSANVKIELIDSAGNQNNPLTVLIIDFPYRFKYSIIDGVPHITIDGGKLDTQVFLLSFDNPEERIDLCKNGDVYMIPEAQLDEVLKKNEYLICSKHSYCVLPRKLLLRGEFIETDLKNAFNMAKEGQEKYGTSWTGQILDKLVDKEVTMTCSSNAKELLKEVQKLLEELRALEYIKKQQDKLLDSQTLLTPEWDIIKKWIMVCKKGYVHAQSIWDLIAISKNCVLLERLAYILWAETPEYKTGELLKFLLHLQEQLVFEWYWLKLDNLNYTLFDIDIFNKACMNHNVEVESYPQTQNILELQNKLLHFYEELKKLSIDDNPEEQENDFIDAPRADNSEGNYIAILKEFIGRDIRLADVRDLIVDYLKMHITDNDILQQDDQIKRTIRYYHKYDRQYFNNRFKNN